MDKKLGKGGLRSTVLYLAVFSLLVWLIFFKDLTVGNFSSFLPYLPDQLASLSLDIILIPILVSFSIFYIASFFGRTFEGSLAEVAVGSLYSAGFAAFFSLFFILHPSSLTMNQAGYLILAAFTAIVVYNIFSTISRIKKAYYIKAIAASATIYIIGQVAIRIISLLMSSSGAPMSPELTVAVANTVNLGVSIAAVFSLFAVFKYSSNPYLSALGGMASNYLFSVSLSLIGALYYGFFLGMLSTFAPGVRNLSPYVEWTGICVIAALIYTVMRRGMHGSIMDRSIPGDWSKHLQKVATYKGDRFVEFTEIIDDFVKKGVKDELLVNLTLFLNENQVSMDNISKQLSELINYEDEKKSSFSRSGRNAVIENENVKKRLQVLQLTLNRIIPTRNEGGLMRGSSEENISNNPSKTGMNLNDGKKQ